MSSLRSSRRTPANHAFVPPAEGAELRRDAIAGLAGEPKTLPCKYLYDARGSALFERICELDEYYPTRVETSILKQNLGEIAEVVGANVRLVEFGSGSAAKTRLLLKALTRPAEYVPIDIARSALVDAAASIALDFPALRVMPVYADYTEPLRLPRDAGSWRTVVFFPGSTIGNFEPEQAEAFLRRTLSVCKRSGGVLIGVDLRKDRGTLEAAYDDAAGVTAAFNLNLLARLNRECGTDFDPAGFAHRAHYDERAGRVEMHLVSTRRQRVTFPRCAAGAETVIGFEAGEAIVTEHSYKYTLGGFAEVAERAGFESTRTWTDPARLFSVHWLTPRAAPNDAA